MELLATNKLPMHSSHDAHELNGYLRSHLAGAQLKFIETDRRPARIGGFRVGALSLAMLDFGTSVEYDADVTGDHHIMSACLRGSAELSVDRQKLHLTAGCGFLARPAERIRGHTSPDYVSLIMRLDSGLLDVRGAPALNEAINPRNPMLQPLFEQLTLILSSPPYMKAISDDTAIAQRAEQLLVSLLKSTGTLYPHQSTTTYCMVSGDVRRAEMFIRRHAADAIGLADIVLASGVSARALQNNFMRFRRMGPIKFLRNVRLEEAHERLLACEERTLISGVAFECGFTHLGRFSSFYRHKYGEAPSETLRRSRCSVGSASSS